MKRPARKSTTIRALFKRLCADATLHGVDQSHDFSRGARLAVRVRDTTDHQRQVSVTFSRPRVPLGDEELATFIRQCDVPTTARRTPTNGQDTRDAADDVRWWYVNFQWTENDTTEQGALL